MDSTGSVSGSLRKNLTAYIATWLLALLLILPAILPPPMGERDQFLICMLPAAYAIVSYAAVPLSAGLMLAMSVYQILRSRGLRSAGQAAQGLNPA